MATNVLLHTPARTRSPSWRASHPPTNSHTRRTHAYPCRELPDIGHHPVHHNCADHTHRIRLCTVVTHLTNSHTRAHSFTRSHTHSLTHTLVESFQISATIQYIMTADHTHRMRLCTAVTHLREYGLRPLMNHYFIGEEGGAALRERVGKRVTEKALTACRSALSDHMSCSVLVAHFLCLHYFRTLSFTKPRCRL